MNRTIKFRGKRCKDGEWVYGSYVESNTSWNGHKPHKSWILPSPMTNGGWFSIRGSYPVIDETVGQFTGCLDKNGKDIYEGDVVKWIYTYYENDTGYSHDLTKTSEVFFRYGIFSVKDYPYNLCECDDVNSKGKETLEVIGNIFDNPALLKGGDND